MEAFWSVNSFFAALNMKKRYLLKILVSDVKKHQIELIQQKKKEVGRIEVKGKYRNFLGLQRRDIRRPFLPGKKRSSYFAPRIPRRFSIEPSSLTAPAEVRNRHELTLAPASLNFRLRQENQTGGCCGLFHKDAS